MILIKQLNNQKFVWIIILNLKKNNNQNTLENNQRLLNTNSELLSTVVS